MIMESAATKPGKKKGIEKYEVDSAVETLLRAEEIKQNKPLMVEVHKAMAKKKKAFTSIASLKAKRDEMFAPKDSEDAADEDSEG
jgi:hypothetical protein